MTRHRQKHKLTVLILSFILLFQLYNTTRPNGILFQDDFSSGLGNWAGMNLGPIDGAAIKDVQIIHTGTQKAVNLEAANKMIQTTQKFQTHQFDEEVWIFTDYLDLDVTSARYAQAGFHTANSSLTVSYYCLSTHSTQHSWKQYDPIHRGWIHGEQKVKLPFASQYHYKMIQYGAKPNGLYYDNVVVASTHGPQEINVDPLTRIMDGFQILSKDYAGWDGSKNNQQFNFQVSDINAILGRSDWNGEIFALHFPIENIVAEVYLYSSSNGGSLGDGYGRFVNDGSYRTKYYITTGSYLFFSQDKTKVQADFVLEDGTCDYEGPTRQHNLQLCSDFCKDYETLEEAMQKCNDDAGCDGVTYSHKYWGDKNSKGFGTMGYGYQLRKFSDRTSRTLTNSKRYFEHSWVKRETPLTSSCNKITPCQFACQTCNAGTCSQCKDGYYNDGGVCKVCDESCDTCSNGSSCDTCAGSYFDDAGTCKKCAAHCQSCDNINHCTIVCPTNCISCDGNGTCIQCEAGYDLDPDTFTCSEYNTLLEIDFTDPAGSEVTGNFEDNTQTAVSDWEIGEVRTDLQQPQLGMRPKVSSSFAFSKQSFRSVQFTETLYFSVDYLDFKNRAGDGSRYIQVGFNAARTGITAGLLSNDKSQHSWAQYHPPNENWIRCERPLNVPFASDHYLSMIQYGANNSPYLANFKVSTFFGNRKQNIAHFNYTMGGLQIQAVDHDGFTRANANQQTFSFHADEVDRALGRKDWNGETFEMYNQQHNNIWKVILYRQYNGATRGDSWGRFSSSTTYGASLDYFNPGYWLFFAKHLRDDDDGNPIWEKPDGTCEFEGPFFRQELELCALDCVDFATLEEAMQRCIEETECQGITFAHRYHGSHQSKGFHDGYGFQLRKNGLRASSTKTLYQSSWKKRDTALTSDCIKINDCHITCTNCINSVCHSCLDGYYVDSNSCTKCSEGCEKCGSGSACTQCQDGYFLSGGACQRCNPLKCMTCNGSADTCVKPCPANCVSCNEFTCTKCDYGYHIKHEVCEYYDVQLHEDFESYTDGTLPTNAWVADSSLSQVVNTTVVNVTTELWDTQQALYISHHGVVGKIFSTPTLQTKMYYGKAWVFVDYLNFETDPAYHTHRYSQIGLGPNFPGGVGTVAFSNDPTQHAWKQYTPIYHNWVHHEYEISLAPEVDQRMAIIAHNKGGQYFDNLMVTQSAGPALINHDGFNFTHKGFQILSVDYTGFTRANANQQWFSFNSYECDRALGRTDWNGETFAMLYGHTGTIYNLVLYTKTNGGTIGDAWGKFTSSTTYGASLDYFKEGNWLYFDKQYSRVPADFIQESGTCDFEGPFVYRSLELCAENCQDYPTLEEAMTKCLESNDCEGVTFTHKYWGDYKAKGYYHGYGYQLRKSILVNRKRSFEYSFLRRDTPLTSNCVILEKCHNKCQNCQSDGTCTQCADGYFVNSNNTCQVCSKNCATCSDESSCDTCADQYFEKSGQCEKCNIFRCATCTGSRDNCVVPCDPGCQQCDETNRCKKCSEGFSLKLGKCENFNIFVDEDFESYTDFIDENVWVNKTNEKLENTKVEIVDTEIWGKNKAARIKNIGDPGQMYHKQPFRSRKYDNYMYASIDYLDFEVDPAYLGNRYTQSGMVQNKASGGGILFISNHHSQHSWKQFDKPRSTWIHTEHKILGTPEVDLYYTALIHAGETWYDNIVVSSAMGPQLVNHPAYNYTHRGFQILAVDYNGFTKANANQQMFSFNSYDVDVALGRTNWSGEKFGMLFGEYDNIWNVRLIRESIGASEGDAHGYFTTSTTYGASLDYFNTGEWLFFDKNQSQNSTDFIRETGTCAFEGPFRRKSLELCAENCQDYPTMEEAMTKCLESDDCEGVTYSHKYWGDYKSQGFYYGYGYQLRKSVLTDRKRPFEFSYLRRDTPLTSNCVILERCHNKCQDCQPNGTCNDCVDGYFINNLFTCQVCSKNCETCRDADTCDTCADGYFMNTDGICEQCNVFRCATCSGDRDSCVQACDAECQQCDSTNKCKRCSEGYHLRLGKCVSFNIFVDENFDNYSDGEKLDVDVWVNKDQTEIQNNKASHVDSELYGVQKAFKLDTPAHAGQIYHKKPLRSRKYDNYMHVSMDYLDFNVDPAYVGNRYTQSGLVQNFPGSVGTIYHSNHYTQHSWKQFTIPQSTWIHKEHKLAAPVEVDLRYTTINHGTECWIDNVVVASAMGPQLVNHPAYNYTHRGFQILAVDYDGFTKANANQQIFKFNSYDADIALGRTNWSGEKFGILFGEFDIVYDVRLIREDIGGSAGDSHGYFTSSTTYGASVDYYNTGEWLFFDRNQAKTSGDFIKESGTCDFEGPFRRRSLELCANNCEDFPTMEEAMQKCKELEECGGVTYSHKYWGDYKSQGFYYGYGYQLRKSVLVDRKRDFEFSYLKRDTPLGLDGEYCAEITKCHPMCTNCEGNICRECADGYFQFAGTCGKCDVICKTCREEFRCDTCADQYYMKGGQCFPCDNSKCATCETSADACIMPCGDKCTFCDPDGKCKNCETGYKLQLDKCVEYNIFLQEDFDLYTDGQAAPSGSWMANNQSEQTNALVMDKETELYGTQRCIRSNLAGLPGQLFSNKQFEPIKYDNYVWVIMDILNEEKDPGLINTRYFQSGITTVLSGSIGVTVYSNHATQHSWKQYRPPQPNWLHFEYKATITAETKHRLTFLSQQSTTETFIDNILVTSAHGPESINHDGYNFIYPGFQIMSVTYDKFTKANANQQVFNFDSHKVDLALGRDDWNGEYFAMYFPRFNTVWKVRLYQRNIGGNQGDGYGTFSTSTTYGASLDYFVTGDWLYFDNIYSKEPADFKKLSGTCQFEGPFRQRTLADCADYCRDYPTIQEAMEKCLEIEECEGITWSHKYWGDYKSTGYFHGYGYQLRKHALVDNKRNFEFSYTKREVAQEQDCIDLIKCHAKCIECDHNYHCKNCAQGYFVENKSCTLCDKNCKTCSASGSCDTCADQYYESGGECLPCDPTKCATCSVSATNCDVSCISHCVFCDETNKCHKCQNGYMLKLGQCVKFNIQFEEDFTKYNTTIDFLDWTDSQNPRQAQPNFEPVIVETDKFGKQKAGKMRVAGEVGAAVSTTEISAVKYDSYVWFSMDYLDAENPKYFQSGLCSTTALTSFAPLFVSTDISQRPPSYVNSRLSKNWYHYEKRLTVNAANKLHARLISHKADQAHVDNIIISTAHGPHYYNRDPNSFIYPGFQIMGVDYNQFSKANANQQLFSFDVKDVDLALGRTNWNGERFALLHPRYDTVWEMYLYNKGIGTTYGNGYGRFTTSTTYGASQDYFVTGEWLFFSHSRTNSTLDFVRMDGYSEMVGPYKFKSLARCVNECEDFETLQEATEACMISHECEGITYTYKYDGDINTKGFAGGYGYQLRKHELVHYNNEQERLFQYSWLKRPQAVAEHLKIARYGNVCKVGNPSNDLCIECKRGYYESSGKCIKCHFSCSSCTDASTCEDCAPQYFKSGSDCLKCDDTQCMSCTGSATTCDTDMECPDNCLRCNHQECVICEEGYFRKHRGCQNYNIIFQDDFETTDTPGKPDSTKWQKHSGGASDQHDIQDCDNGSKCLTFTQIGNVGQIYTKDKIQSVQYDQEMFFMFDVKESAPTVYMQGGLSTTNTGTPSPVFASSHSTQHSWATYVDSTNNLGKWNHHEGRISPGYATQYFVNFIDYSTTPDLQIDNVFVTSGHGLNKINKCHFDHTNPCLQILSVDYDNYQVRNADQTQFNFDSYQMDILIGRNDWNGELFSVYLPFENVKYQVRLSRTNNGGRIGDAWGRVHSGLTNKKFKTGDYLVFSKDFSTLTTDIAKHLDSICTYEGPLLATVLADCSNDCQDYETIFEAMEACDASPDCEGVSYTHKYWGGANSQGFDSMAGYGYQLRKGAVFKKIQRRYQATWTKRDTPLSSNCNVINACGRLCKTCDNVLKKCTESIPGYYLDSNFAPQVCNVLKCSTCSDWDTCTDVCDTSNNCLECNGNNECHTCKPGYYKEGNACLQCADNCVTCLFTASNCIITCPVGCQECAGSFCLTPLPGYFVHPGSGAIGTCDYTKCAQCTTKDVCVPGYEIPVGCSYVKPDLKCSRAHNGYYLDGDEVAQPCHEKCKTCSGPADTQCTSAAPGFYLDGGSVYPCDHTICATCRSDTVCIAACPVGCNLCDKDRKCSSAVDGYYIDGDVAKPCDDGCATCSGPGSCDIACPDNCDKCLPDTTCTKASIGWFLDRHNNVRQCQEPCAECFKRATSCLSVCPTGCLRCDYDDCIQAKDGYFLDGLVAKVCDQTRCATCSDFATCIKPCPDGCTKCSAHQCYTAEDGFYLDINKKIWPCNGCATCNGPNDCIIPCPANCKRCQVDQTCTLADDGYFLDGGVLTQCNHNKCATCTTLTDCVVPCVANCKTCNAENVCQSAADGYYINPADDSINPCDDGCATCVQAGSCLISCPANCSRCLPDQTCTQADDGYFVDTDDSVVQCDHLKCSTCTSLVDCVVPCHNGCNECDQIDDCVDATPGYFVDSVDNKAKQCDAGCATCSAAGSCDIACNANCARCLADLTCTEADPGYYIDTANGNLEQCNDLLCATCTSLISCIVPCHAGCKQCNAADECVVSEDGYYVDTGDNKAKPCDAGCATCASAGSCTISCNANCYRCLPDQTCTIADDGYFVDTDDSVVQCDHFKCATCYSLIACKVACHAGCKQCDKDNKCVVSDDGFYVDSGSIAQRCDVGCATCSAAGSCDIACNANCVSCLPDQTCTQSEPGYYLDVNKDVQQCDVNRCATCVSSRSCILPCPPGCATCNANYKCDVASPGYWVNGSNNAVKCKVGCATCSNGTTCDLDCPANCYTCRPDQTCITTDPGYFIDNDDGLVYQCNQYKCARCYGHADICIQACHSGCKRCDGQNHCLEARDGYYINGNSASRCDAGCATCTTSGSCDSVCHANCKYCDVDQVCQVSNPGYFVATDNSVQQCNQYKCAQCISTTQCTIPCSYGCHKCDHTNTCIEAKPGHWVDGGVIRTCPSDCATCDNSGVCVIHCPLYCSRCTTDGTCTKSADGYFLDGDNNIQQCDHTKCATCVSLTQCIWSCGFGCSQCNAARVCTHPIPGYWNDGGFIRQCDRGCATCSSSGSCDIDCPTNCKQCKGDQTCISANPGYYLDTSNNVQQCNHNVCATCIQRDDKCTMYCPLGCQVCNEVGHCTTPKDGYWLNGGTLTQCNEGCATCSDGSNCIDSCPTNCIRCLGDGTCLEGSPGWYVHPTTGLQQCDNSRCATCISQYQCSLPCPLGCVLCDPTGTCTTARPGYYVDQADGSIKRCGNSCATCDNTGACLTNCPSNCQQCEPDQACNIALPGFFVDINNGVQQCDTNKCATCISKLVCQVPCDLGCSECNAQSVCIAPKDGWYVHPGSGSVIRCDPGCATCMASGSCSVTCPTNCDKCDLNQKCIITTPGYYIDEVHGGTIRRCNPYQCSTCSSATECIQTCPEGCYKCNGAGECLRSGPGYYVDHIAKTVHRCDEGCGVCEGSGECDITCPAFCKYCTPTRQCIVGNDGYYVDPVTHEVGECDNTVCATCDGSPTNCIQSCPLGCSSCTPQNQCLLIGDGYYPHPTIPGTIVRCTAGCGVCASDGTCELQCPDNCNRCTRDLECLEGNDGYYVDETTKDVKECDYSICATCTGPSTCTISCPEGCSLCDIAGTCTQITDGWFDNAGTITQCDEGCATCSASGSCEITCPSNCKRCDSDLTCTEGGDGFVLDDNNQIVVCEINGCAKCSSPTVCAEPCHEGCLMCTPENKCLQSKIGKYIDPVTLHVQDCAPGCGACLNQNICLLQCPANCNVCNYDLSCEDGAPGYYVDTTGNVQQCDQTRCATCSNASTCIVSCQEGCNRCNGLGQCLDAQPGKYVDSGTGEIQPCDVGCATCSEAGSCDAACPTNCKACNASGQCSEADDGWYVGPGNSVTQCNQSVCATCTSATECIKSCPVGCGQCDVAGVCSTPSDGFIIDADGDLLQCDNTKCATCTGTPDNCSTACRPECATCKPSGACESCAMGYYQEGGQCKKCMSGCLSCSSGDSCDACNSEGYMRTQELPSCGCSDGHYEDPDSLDCVQCSVPTCKKCDTTGQCLECENPILRPPYCIGFARLGFFVVDIADNVMGGNDPSDISAAFATCSIQCETCSNTPSNCSTCIFGSNRQQEAPQCKCLDGYHDNDGTQADCLKCSENCLTCSNDIKCLSCDESKHRVLDPFQNTCECEQGYKSNGQSVCQRCYEYQGECLLQCPTNTKLNERSFICVEYEYFPTDNIPLIWMCGIIILIIGGIAIALQYGFGMKMIKAMFVKKDPKDLQKMQKIHPDEPSDGENEQNDNQSDSKSQISVLIEDVDNNSDINSPQMDLRSNNSRKESSDISPTRNDLLNNRSSGTGSGDSNQE